MEKTVYIFRKNANEEVRASIRKFKNRIYVSLAVWAEKDTGHLEFLRTTKGLTLSAYVLPELKKAVMALEEELARLGLLEAEEKQK